MNFAQQLDWVRLTGPGNQSLPAHFPSTTATRTHVACYPWLFHQALKRNQLRSRN